MIPPHSLQLKNSGDPIMAEEWNAILLWLRKLDSFSATPPLLLQQSPGGVTLSLGKLLTVYLCKLTGNRTGNGKYQCVVYAVTQNFRDSTRSVTTTDIEAVTLYAEGTYVNLQEASSSTHSLTHADNTLQKYFIAHRDGADENGKPCFFGNGLWTSACA